jgi:hypothetical protein
MVLSPVQAPTTTPSNIAWSSSGTRTDLMSKVSTYFSTTRGDFVNKNSMMAAAPRAPASRTVMEAKASNLSAQFNYWRQLALPRKCGST